MAHASIRTWEELIAEGRTLVKDLNQRRWELGDLALEIAPMGASHAHNDAEVKLARFATEIGLELRPVEQYRQVAMAWPQSTRVPSASWSVHREMMSDPDRSAKLRGMAQEAPEGRVTVDYARRAAGRPAHRPSDAAGKAAVIREHLRDPEVQREIAKDPKATSALHLASAKVGDLNREEMVADQRKTGHLALSAFYQASGQLHGAAHRVRVALKLLREVSMTDEDTRESILADLHNIKVAVDWVESYVRSGNRSFEDELAALLADPPKDAA